MIPIYEEKGDHIQIEIKKAGHFPPHLHESLEFVYVVKGSVAVGQGTDLFEAREGDIAVIFPSLIHHFQVFSKGPNKILTLLASPSYFSGSEDILQTYRPQDPIIRRENLHPNVTYALNNLLEISKSGREGRDGKTTGLKKEKKLHGRSDKEKLSDRADNALSHAFVQIILARLIPELKLIGRVDLKEQDIVYQTVTYIATHYEEDISLTMMAEDLGISQFALSRVFSGTFHQSFNQYLNEVRLEHVAALLLETSRPVTEIFLDCGFQSQATFNRVFHAKYHMTPKEYRKSLSAETVQQ